MAKRKPPAKAARKSPAVRTSRPRVDIFERFAIKALSPSQLQKFAQDPGLWFASARAKVWEDAGPAAWRGDAVEAALYAYLMKGDGDEAEAVMGSVFAKRLVEYLKGTGGEISDEFEAAFAEATGEADRAFCRAVNAANALGLGQPTAYNVGVEAHLPGISVPVYGRPDFCFVAKREIRIEREPEAIIIPEGERFSLDLKTTGQMPSAIKPDHGISTSLYARARGERFALTLYVSTGGDKVRIPHRLHALTADEMMPFIRAATETAHRLKETLTNAAIVARYRKRDPEQVLAEMCRPNLLARGGGTFDLWKPDYAERTRAAVAAWR